jgi:hypothetical protein
MAEIARLKNVEIVPFSENEPITLNSARQVRDYLVKEHIKSVSVLTPILRSRRSFLIYNSVFQPSGIAVHCDPVSGPKGPENWTRSWHGIQEVVLQFVKLQYYRFWVLL